MKVSTENDNNFGYEKITIVVDNIPLIDMTILLLKKSTMFQKGGREAVSRDVRPISRRR
jgi:hypothetical protein